MKYVPLNEAINFANSDKCIGKEYHTEDENISVAISKISGRYPDKGYCVNVECKELIYVIDGEGTLTTTNQVVSFKKGDVVLIDKGERFYWNGECEVVAACAPAWFADQHLEVE